jgi:plasmid stabilization system protein ParE
VGQYQAKPQVDEDLVRAAGWIRQDNPDAAERFLDAAFHSFEFLERYPEAGPKCRFRQPRLKEVRFWVLPPPFNKWLVFYRIESDTVYILRVLYGAQNWRDEPESFL